MTKEDKKELEKLRKIIKNYQKMDLQQKNKVETTLLNDNTKVDYLKPPQEKIEEDVNENSEEGESEEIEEEVEADEQEDGAEGEGEA